MQKERDAEENPEVKDSIPLGLGFSLGARSEDIENFAMMTPEERAIYDAQGRTKEDEMKSEQVADGIANFRILNNNQ